MDDAVERAIIDIAERATSAVDIREQRRWELFKLMLKVVLTDDGIEDVQPPPQIEHFAIVARNYADKALKVFESLTKEK